MIDGWSAASGMACRGDAPAAYGPHKTLYNRFIRWNRPHLRRPGRPKPERVPAYRAYQGRTELQAACRLRWRRPTDHPAVVGRPDEGSQRCPSRPRCAASSLTTSLQTEATIAAGSDNNSKPEASSRASRRAAAAKSRTATTRLSTASATKSRTSSPNSRTGAASQPNTTAALTPSSQRSASQPPSLAGFLKRHLARSHGKFSGPSTGLSCRDSELRPLQVHPPQLGRHYACGEAGGEDA